MDHTITVDAVGSNIITITHGESLFTTEISHGRITITTGCTLTDTLTIPVTLEPRVHKGKLDITDQKGRLVYSWRSLPQLLATRPASDVAEAATSQQQTGITAAITTIQADTGPVKLASSRNSLVAVLKTGIKGHSVGNKANTTSSSSKRPCPEYVFPRLFC